MADSKTDTVSLLAAMGVGVAAAYLFDPERGTGRRALAGDKLTKTRRKTAEAAAMTARDLSHRAKGMAVETWSRWRGQRGSDDVLKERVRAKLGFLVRHPSAIDVQVSEGVVTLSGPVLSEEVQQLLRGVRSVRDVLDVSNALDVHENSGDIPGLQGEPRPRGEVWDVLQDEWSPSTRFLVAVAGTILFAYAMRRGFGSSLTTLRGRRGAHNEEWPTHSQGAPGWLG